MRAYAATDIGRCREINQDYVYYSSTPIGGLPNLFVVADGMGGHRAGDLASRYTVDTLVGEICSSKNDNPITIVSNAILSANSKLIAKAGESEDYTGMGTTLVVATVLGSSLYVANVGDSRLYLYDGDLKQITRDHSLVEEMVSIGKLDRSEARTHKQKNIITRAVGTSEDIMADFFEVEIKPGNVVLMCSDGLTNMVEDSVIAQVLQKDLSAEQMAGELFKLANDNGGSDNIAIVIIKL